ncbi:RNA polymerase sigma factor [Steroidobacter agaridevorans]|uniref:RNA polymerase sigma factor n=1 Tax=Steroidobacter agaridevorans TaxID=2695856 RepID=UPI001320B565|nr:sigma-70 family RNA polymerase sigma factor [Steroidobacter agaridevorans]GFE90142.1 DNA-directed RNA polymerase sigma-70 factor [Steroidobacter agaridevorans]
MVSQQMDMANAGSREPADKVDWDAVYADQLPRIYNYFRFRLGGEAEVEDLTARTFEKAWSARARYRRDLAGFSTWLFRIAQNVGIDYLRSRHPHAPLDAAVDLAAEITPELEAARDSDLSRLGRLTARLPEREQELIALKYGAALNNREIARLTGLSESNVGTSLYRIVQTLRSQW